MIENNKIKEDTITNTSIPIKNDQIQMSTKIWMYKLS